MKLKDQFENLEIMFENQIGTLKYDELSEVANQCVLIAESFAINFANWYEFMLRQSDNLNQRFTPKELIEMFKKEKGL
jgi:hypothetical protein